MEDDENENNPTPGQEEQPLVNVGENPAPSPPPVQVDAMAPEEHPPVETPEEPSPTTNPEEKKPNVEGLEKVVVDSSEIVSQNQNFINEQRKRFSTMLFVLKSINETLTLYKDLLKKLKSFVYNNEIKQAEWRWQYRKDLPQYGDYKKALPEASEAIQVEGVPHPLAKGKLEELINDVVSNMNDGVMIVGTQKDLGNDIRRRMEAKDHMLMAQLCSMKPWFDLFNTEMCSWNDIENTILEITNFLGYLKTGVLSANTSLKLDLSKVPVEEW